MIFDAHQLISKAGLVESRKLARTKLELNCITAAIAMLDVRSPSDVIYASPAIASLAHSRLMASVGERETWSRDLKVAAFRLESGADRDGHRLGLPFGAKARMILIWLHDLAITGQSRILDVPPSAASVHAWVRQLTTEVGGMTYRLMLNQALRLATCRIAIDTQSCLSHTKPEPMVEAVVIGDQRIVLAGGDAQPLTTNEMPRQIILGDAFFRYVTGEALPLRRSALPFIANNSWAIDLYLGLAYFLPRLTEPIAIAWSDFSSLAAVGYKHKHQTKTSVLSALPLALAVYPGARVETDQRGINLYPSPPAV